MHILAYICCGLNNCIIKRIKFDYWDDSSFLEHKSLNGQYRFNMLPKIDKQLIDQNNVNKFGWVSGIFYEVQLRYENLTLEKLRGEDWRYEKYFNKKNNGVWWVREEDGENMSCCGGGSYELDEESWK